MPEPFFQLLFFHLPSQQRFGHLIEGHSEISDFILCLDGDLFTKVSFSQCLNSFYQSVKRIYYPFDCKIDSSGTDYKKDNADQNTFHQQGAEPFIKERFSDGHPDKSDNTSLSGKRFIFNK